MLRKATTVMDQTKLMISDRQQAYLDALGIEVWTLRASESCTSNVSPYVSPDVAGDAPGLKLASGRGGVLLVCAVDADSASRLANDISRALGSTPVWSWPDDEENAVQLPVAVDENLFTTVAIFGRDLAARFFGTEIPGSLSSAKLVVLPSMQELESQPLSRESLWATICRSGMVSRN